MRYTRGRAELECRATYNTEKSLPMNDAVRQMKAKATNKNWPYAAGRAIRVQALRPYDAPHSRSEEHTSELQSLMRLSSAVFCLTQKEISKYEPAMTVSSTKTS